MTSSSLNEGEIGNGLAADRKGFVFGLKKDLNRNMKKRAGCYTVLQTYSVKMALKRIGVPELREPQNIIVSV